MKKLLLPFLIITASLLITARLFYLQLINESYKLQAENNAVKIKYEYPERGYIYDRNGKLMIANQPSYDIMVVPREVRDLDTLKFCEALNISREYFSSQIQKAITYSPWLPSPFLAQLNKKEFAAFQEQMRRFKGFYIQKRYLRDYHTKSGANVFGDIAQVNQREIDKDFYYKSGDLIGKNGIEKSYEHVLRGTKGIKRIQRDKLNRELNPYKGGIYDTLAVRRGKDITLTLDIDLQEYGESLMVNKRGGIVALDPKTGEILALVSAPSFDPSVLVGRERSENFTKLYHDTINRPLFDRGLMGEYVPGSTFKIVTALIGIQEGAIDTKTTFLCNHGFSYGRGAFMKCHDSGNIDLHNGIRSSCNTFFAQTYRKTIDKYKTGKEGMDIWSNHVKSFGLGNYLGYDLPTGRIGLIPDGDFYNKRYPNRWGGTTTISNAIGQGEILTTPIQLATMMSAVANRGHYYTPHIIKSIEGEEIDKKFVTRKQTTINPKHFEPVVEGLHAVYTEGTARRLQIPDIDICGKTGTAENYMKINGVRTQLTDHSIFLAFAPKNNPQIVIAVFVENGYWGARYAGPIASLMIEKYLKREITRKDLEERMYSETLEHEYDKPYSGKPFLINQNNIVKKVDYNKAKHPPRKESEGVEL